MRILFTLSLLFLSIATKAQPRLEAGLTGGGNIVTGLTGWYNLKDLTKSSFSKDIVKGYSGTVKLIVDTRKWQFGLAAETGSLRGTLIRDISTASDMESTMYAPVIYGKQPVEKQNVAGPYVSPYLLINYKFNFSEAVYLYLGPLGGRMFAVNDLTWDGKASGWLAGGNIGVLIRLTDRLYLDITEGWRKIWVRGPEISSKNARQTYNAKIVDNEHFEKGVALAINNYNLSYVNSSLGIRIIL